MRKNDPRVQMYKDARAILEGSIALTKGERVEHLEVALMALEKACRVQCTKAAHVARTIDQAARARLRIEAMYESDIRKLKEELKSLGRSVE